MAEYYPRVHLTRESSNRKTGPIPVSTSANETCPPECPFIDDGCYAAYGPLGMFWGKVSQKAENLARQLWGAFLDSIRELPVGELWRHNQAGDLPGKRSRIHAKRMRELIKANKGRRGFTYTHKPMLGTGAVRAINRQLIKEANAAGFTVNLSANHVGEVDKLAALGVGPVVVVMPVDWTGTAYTPAGRKIVQCPATRPKPGTENNKKSEPLTDCARCQLCAKGERTCVVGFPAHGAAKRKAEKIAIGN